MNKETLEEAAERLYGLADKYSKNRIGFIEGAKWQQERMYSEEEVLELLNNLIGENPIDVEQWFKQYKKQATKE